MEVIHENFEGELFEIWKNGENPKLLILSGTHGDESSTIPLIKDCLISTLPAFPNFIYVPRVSPSAVGLKTRANKDGLDVNRRFKSGAETSEVRYLEKVIGENRFSLVASFHEDTGHKHFYLYDYVSEQEKRDISKIVGSFKGKLRKIGVELLNGIDDPADLELGYDFKDGYRIFSGKFQADGQFEHYAILKDKAKRILVPEIPTALPPQIKKQIINILFKDLILKVSLD